MTEARALFTALGEFYALAGAGAAASPPLGVLRDQLGRLLATMIPVAGDDPGGWR